MKRVTFLTLVAILFLTSYGQSGTGKILVLSNVPGHVLVDGSALGDAEPNKPLLHDVAVGDHLVQLAFTSGGKAEVRNEVIVVEEGKQKVVNFSVDIAPTSATVTNEHIKVAELNVPIPGLLTGASSPPDFYYAFEVGDEVLLDITMSNLKGTNALVVSTYPGGVEIYSNRGFQTLTDQHFKIAERGIYRFALSTNHVADRNAFVKVRRIPSSPDKAGFNTNVVKRTKYSSVQVCEKQEFYINSYTNLSGKTRSALSVNLPANTIEWYYRFSASREEADIARVQQTAGLVVELAAGLATAGASTMLASGAQGLTSFLTQPPGANFCDIYLLDHANYSPFLSKLEFRHYADGTRENFKSGNVRVACCKSGQYYLGVRNNDSMYGIHVFLDVVALTAVDELVMEELD